MKIGALAVERSLFSEEDTEKVQRATEEEPENGR
jgi:hypothetical protein